MTEELKDALENFVREQHRINPVVLLENMHFQFIVPLTRYAEETGDTQAIADFAAAYDKLYARMVELHGDRPETVQVCASCGGSNVQDVSWYDLNTGEPGDQYGEGDFWCTDCEGHEGADEIPTTTRERWALIVARGVQED